MSDKKRFTHSKVAILPGGRIPPMHSDAIRMAFLDGRLRWARDLDGDTAVLRCTATPMSAPVSSNRPRSRVQVTVGDIIAEMIAQSDRKLNS